MSETDIAEIIGWEYDGKDEFYIDTWRVGVDEHGYPDSAPAYAGPTVDDMLAWLREQAVT